jgi:hypothetical protein
LAVLSRLALAAAVILGALACRGPTTEIGRLYEDFRSDLAHRDPSAPQTIERHSERAARARAIAYGGQLETAEANFQAAVLLVETDEIQNLTLARELAFRAAELGEPLALRVAAEAIDKLMVRQGMHQVYGTQFILDPDRGWQLYPWDPRTTDVDRAAMGVEPLAELLRKPEAWRTEPDAGDDR